MLIDEKEVFVLANELRKKVLQQESRHGRLDFCLL
jgi:hypothetical protein